MVKHLKKGDNILNGTAHKTGYQPNALCSQFEEQKIKAAQFVHMVYWPNNSGKHMAFKRHLKITYGLWNTHLGNSFFPAQTEKKNSTHRDVIV